MLTSLFFAVATAAIIAGPSTPYEPHAAPVAWRQAGTADSLYFAGRAAFNDNRDRRAVEIYAELLDRYPRSARAADALYYKAYALFRLGERNDLRAALADLDRYERSYGNSADISEARQLRTRVCGKLASTGDAECAQELVTSAGGREPGTRSGSPTGAPPASGAPGTRGAARAAEDDDDERMMALNALMQMNSANAMPILRNVLADRSERSVKMREQAVFLISQKAGRDVVDILVDVAKNDPAPNVRENAVFWLSQTRDPRAVDVLEEMLMQSNDRAIQSKAIFALSQVSNARSNQILRAYAERKGAPENLRADAIFWLSQSNGDVGYLRELYGRLTERELKDKVIFGLSQTRSGRPMLLEIAKNTSEDPELRKQAIFWLGQGSSNASELMALFATLTDTELKNQVIFSMTQSSDRTVLDKLIEIARTDKDKEVKKQAIFWLGQSRDPRAIKFIEELINR